MGVHLVGEYVGIPAEVRLFSHSAGDLSFTVTEFFDTKTQKHVKPGYDLVEATFVLRSAEADDPGVVTLENAAELSSSETAN